MTDTQLEQMAHDVLYKISDIRWPELPKVVILAALKSVRDSSTGSPSNPRSSVEAEANRESSSCDTEAGRVPHGAAEMELGSVAPIFAVFSADGCECEFLEGVFSTREKADARVAYLKDDPYTYGDPQFVTIRELRLDAPLPICGTNTERKGSEGLPDLAGREAKQEFE